jgi:D-lactate dehydrogenase
VTFPVPSLASAVIDLQALFVKHRYDEAIIFGHAKDGNLHFLLTQGFSDAAEIERYERFMDDCVELVVKKYDGSLKAEHGTGRNMAPFVETEWGSDAYAVMKEVKALVDPDGLLNPGVIINPDPRAHVTNLKSLPEVEDEVDRCIECGFCESHCPSRDLTLTPRQRIVVRREMKRSGNTNGALRDAYEYDALDTCATDGLCAVACPVRIDTGQLTKRLRASGHSAMAHRTAAWTARHFRATGTLVRTSLAAGRRINTLAGRDVMGALTRRARSLTRRSLPAWIEPMPGAASSLPVTDPAHAAAVYFPSCVTRTLGESEGANGAGSTAALFVAVAGRAGLPLHIPADTDRHCCGQPYSSKGFPDAHAIAINDTVAGLWEASRHGEIPIVVDTSPCTYSLRSREGLTPENRDRAARLRILDGVEFFATEVLPKLTIHRRTTSVTLHPVCSLVKMGLAPQLTTIASACSDRVFIPPSTGCCGFAGDRGWLLPELTAAATASAAVEVKATAADGWYSSSRTCEIGMARATGKPYRSWIHLLDWATRESLIPNP